MAMQISVALAHNELLMTALGSGKVPTVTAQRAENVPTLPYRNNVRVRQKWLRFSVQPNGVS
jgi:hypothetical protein